jgi:hypothetical protein
MSGLFAVKFTAVGKLLPKIAHGVEREPAESQVGQSFRFCSNGL